MHKAAKNLLNAWKSLDNSKPPYILPGDEVIREYTHKYKNYKTFISDKYYGDIESTKFHTGLLPVPYSGNILKAKIFILALNPGFSIRDYYEESHCKKIISKRKQRLKNINSEKDFPWLSLNPEFAWTGGYDYWTKKLNPIIKKIMVESKISYVEVLQLLSKNIAVLELVPYHSKSFGLPESKMDKLESVRLMRSFVKQDLFERASKNETIIIVTRKAKYWELPKHRNVIVYNNKQARSSSFGLNSDGGKAILNLLSIP